MKVGLVIMDENPADALRVVRAADQAGVHSLWSIDYYNRSSLTRAAAFAAVSRECDRRHERHPVVRPLAAGSRVGRG